MSLTDQSFAYAADLVRRETAILYSPGDEHLVEARLAPLAEDAGCADVDAYVERLRTDAVERALALDALAGTETSWYRDNTAYMALATAMLPALLESRAETRHLTFWSAAGSSGQEAYSLAMVLDERLPQGWTAEIWATDVSARMVERARAGLYSQVEMNRGLPATALVKYFTRVGPEWQVAPRLRAMVRAERVNLAIDLPALPTFDVVFLRNVLGAFDAETRRLVLDRVRDVAAPDGYLVLDSTELDLELGCRWTREPAGRTSVHRPGPRPSAAGGVGRSAAHFRNPSFLMTGA